MKQFRNLSAKHKLAIIHEVKLMLAAHRNKLWIDWTECSHAKAVDPNEWPVVVNYLYYGEAFGIVRALCAMGYGYFGKENLDACDEGRSHMPEHNLKWWFAKLQREYLDEEGFYDKTCSAEKCQQLLEKYRRLVRK